MSLAASLVFLAVVVLAGHATATKTWTKPYTKPVSKPKPPVVTVEKGSCLDVALKQCKAFAGLVVQQVRPRSQG